MNINSSVLCFTFHHTDGSCNNYVLIALIRWKSKKTASPKHKKKPKDERSRSIPCFSRIPSLAVTVNMNEKGEKAGNAINKVNQKANAVKRITKRKNCLVRP